MKKFLKNHFGFSLVEMITAFAVLGIATLAIGGFFVSSSRSYAGTSAETSLQYEAQMALNQIENKLIDATLGVNYALYDGTDMKFVEKDTIADSSLKAKYLYIFNSDGTNFELLLIKWDIENKELLYKEISLTDSYTDVDDIPIETLEKWELLAEGVKAFSVDLSKYSETKTVDVTLTLEKRDKEFTTTGTITLRNNVLVNEDELQKIYENLSTQKATRIDQVILSASTNVTVPKGEVQLSTKVTGVYPSQDIHEWIVAYKCDDLDDNIIGTDSTLNGNLVQNNTKVDSETKILTIADNVEGSTFHQTVYVQAVVHTKDAAGQLVKVYSNIVAINVRDIKGLVVWPTAKSTDGNNATTLFKNGTNQTANWTQIDSDTPVSDLPTTNIYSGNVIQMNYSLEGTVSSDDDTNVIWTIDTKDSDVTASISESGVLSVDKNSKTGYINVKGTLQGTNYSVIYPFMVSSPYVKNVDTVAVDAPEKMNRGDEPYQCQVSLNGVKGSPSDYDWYVVVTNTAGQTVTGSPVTITSTGVLSVDESLAFDYDYRITVVATLKSNSELQGTDIVPVPKVKLNLTPPTYRAYLGTTIPKGEITCTVDGLANYDINWSMAKETNPTYYFTAYGNTNITGDEVASGKSPVIVIGADEPSSLTYMRVKATLDGYADYYSTMRLNFTDTGSSGGSSGSGGTTTPTIPDSGNNNDDEEEVIPPTGEVTDDYVLKLFDREVYRGDEAWMYICREDEQWDREPADRWEIVSVIKQNGDSASTEGLEIVSVDNDMAKLVVPLDYELGCASKIYVQVAAYKDGKLVQNQEYVTIPAIKLTVTGNDFIGKNVNANNNENDGNNGDKNNKKPQNKGNYYQVRVEGIRYGEGTDLSITWNLLNTDDNPLNYDKIELAESGNRGTYVYTYNAKKDTQFKVCAYLKNSSEVIFASGYKNVKVIEQNNNDFH